MKSSVRARDLRLLLAITVLALLIRLAVSAAFKDHMYRSDTGTAPAREVDCLKTGEFVITDSEQYELLGESIRHRLAYAWNNEPATIRVPGYPLLIAMVGGNTLLLMVVQALLSAATVLFAGLVGRWLFDERVGWVAAALLALDIPSIFSAGVVMSDTLFTFVLVLACYLFVEKRFWAAGLALGAATMTRPLGVFAILPFGVLLVARGQRRAALRLICLFALLPGLWVARNWYHYRRVALTTTGACNLLYVNATALVAHEQGITTESARVVLVRDFTSRTRSDNPLVVGSELTSEALRIISRDPLGYAQVLGAGLVRIVAGVKADEMVMRMVVPQVSGMGASVFTRQPGIPACARVAALGFAGLELLLTLGAFLLAAAAVFRRGGRDWKLLLLALAACFVLAATPLTDGRFRVPAMPLLYLVAASLFLRRSAQTQDSVRAGTVA